MVFAFFETGVFLCWAVFDVLVFLSRSAPIHYQDRYRCHLVLGVMSLNHGWCLEGNLYPDPKHIQQGVLVLYLAYILALRPTLQRTQTFLIFFKAFSES